MSVFTEKIALLHTLQELLQKPKKILITSHLNPDGDAIGSIMGLGLSLEAVGHSITLVVPNPMSAYLRYLDPEKRVLNFDEHSISVQKAIDSAELIFCLDYNTLSRVEKMGELIGATPVPKVLIDHHQNPDDFEFQFSDPEVSSTSEMVFDFLDQINLVEKINEHAAMCLYTGIMTDTGSFRYRGTTSNTLLVGSKLVALGANPAYINDAVHNSSRFDRLQLTGFTLHERLVYQPEIRLSYMYLLLEDLERFNYESGDTEGLVNMPLGISDVDISVFFKEVEKGKIKISFRSKGEVFVNEFASQFFEGGGHRNAAGGVSYKSWEETQRYFLEKFKTFYGYAY
ncbi:MAG: DHH family phosphoesterase [Luteibaculum sp.]